MKIISEPIGRWFEALAKRKTLEIETKSKVAVIEAETKKTLAEKKAEIVSRQATAEIDWDMRALDQAEASWKDEWMMVAIVGPYIAVFFPPLQPHVIKGFEALQALPEWYLASFGVVVAASFGYRGIVAAFRRFGKPI
jgi:hypothetical protein